MHRVGVQLLERKEGGRSADSSKTSAESGLAQSLVRKEGQQEGQHNTVPGDASNDWVQSWCD